MSNYTDQKIDLVINKMTKDQYSRADLSGLIRDDQLYLITDDRGQVSGDTRYALITLNPTLSAIAVNENAVCALTCQAVDLAVNNIAISSNAYPLYVYMPGIPDGDGRRDFCIRVECTAISAPDIVFLGSGSESCDFECNVSSWATLEHGINIFNFTEMRR